MSPIFAQEIDLSNFTGRLFIAGDPSGHCKMLYHLISEITCRNEDVVVVFTGNLFDYGYESMSLLKSINEQRLYDRPIRFFSSMGKGEVRMLQAIPLIQKSNFRFVPDTYLRNEWRVNGGSWHDNENRLILDQEISKLVDNNLPYLFYIKTRPNMKIAVSSAAMPEISNSFEESFYALQSFDIHTAKKYQHAFTTCEDKITDPNFEIKGLDFIFHGEHSTSNIRSSFGLDKWLEPICLGNRLYINTNSRYIDHNNSGALTLIEIDSKESLVFHQIYKNDHNIICLNTKVITVKDLKNEIHI